MRSARSCGFFKPGKTIFVPGMYCTKKIFFLISNKILLKRKKRLPRTQGVYKGEQIKNENYKSQENPKEKKKIS